MRSVEYTRTRSITRLRAAASALVLLATSAAAQVTPCNPQPSSISSNFNGTQVGQGNYIWFTAVVKVSGLGSTQTTNVHFTNSTIRFTAGAKPYTLSVPDATLTFCPSCSPATTTFDGTTWATTVASSGLAGNVFLSGLAYRVPTDFPGGIKPLTWSGTFSSDTPGITIAWQWAAAVYTSFSTNYNSLGVKPVDDDKASAYKNSDHAGTPESFRQFVVGGATGGGGSNDTGSLSGTATVSCPRSATTTTTQATTTTSPSSTTTTTRPGVTTTTTTFAPTTTTTHAATTTTTTQAPATTTMPAPTTTTTRAPTTTSSSTTTTTQPPIQCCERSSPTGAFTDCVLLSATDCAAQNGINVGAGTCSPNPCPPSTTTTSTMPAPTTTTTTQGTTTTQTPTTATTQAPTTTTATQASTTTTTAHAPTTTTSSSTTTTQPPIQCCERSSPAGAFTDCVLLSAADCAAQNGINVGAGTCSPNPCPPSTTTMPAPTTTTTTTIPSPGLPVREICGNCIDDDHNGLTDFEDPACCTGTQKFAMALRRGKLKPHGATTGLRLRTTLAQTGLATVNPLQQDVFLQIRPAGGTEALCAKIPHDKFMPMHGAFKFWDHQHLVASAKGIDDLTVKVLRDGSVRLRTVSRQVQFQTPQQSSLQVTVGFYDAAAGDSANRCSTQTRAFRTGRAGRLIVP